MLDDLFLVLADFHDYRDISQNFDESRLNQSVRESQLDEVSNFLGDELYLKMLIDWAILGNAFTNPLYIKLWLGEDYTIGGKMIRFHGLKPAAVLYAYSRTLDNGQLNLTRTGATDFSDDEVGEGTDQMQIMNKVKSAKAQGLVYLSRAHKYIEANAASYPSYLGKDTEVKNKTGFKWFKV